MTQESFRIGYVDLVDYQHEIGEAAGGNTIYASAGDLKKHQSCWEGCGIAKVKVYLDEIVHPQNLMGNVSAECTWEEYTGSPEYLTHLQKRRERYNNFVKVYDRHIEEWHQKNAQSGPDTPNDVA
jgi:hypothetical protein